MDLVAVAHACAVEDRHEGEDDTVVTNHHVVLDIDKREYFATFADTCHLRLRTDYCATHNLTVLLVNCYHRQGHSRG